jgi:hypothetical protein
MKGKHLIFCMLLTQLAWSQTYNYTPFPQEYGLWHYTSKSDNWVTIGYTEMVYQLDSSTGVMVSTTNGYFEDNHRIYFVSESDTTLKYDFNLTIGDTIIADATFGIDTFYVVSDDSTGYHGRRKITLETNANFYLPTEWVEGIGNTSGFGTLWDNFSAASISGGHIFWCMYADSVTIPCNSALGRLSDSHNEEVELYPNPNQGTLQLKSGILQEHTIRIYNSYGQCIFSVRSPAGGDPIKIQLQDVGSGLYFIEMSNSNIVRTRKFIVNY